jgi:signal transduction histidine kinase
MQKPGCYGARPVGGVAMDSDSQRALKDAEARRLTLAKLAEFLEGQRVAITDQWLMAVRRDPEIAAADKLTHQQLVDHLPEIFEECCTFLRTRDASVLVEDAKADAKLHGGIRWADGYKIDELIRELEVFRGLLGTVVARFSDIDPRFHGPLVAAATSLVQRFFGEVTVHSVARYAEEQQRVVQTYTSQLESVNLELARANTSLQQALSERQRLTAIIAHEVRNFLQGFKYVTRSPNEQLGEAALAHADAQLRDVEDLLGQLLDHTSLIANREPLSVAAFDPVKLHEELTATYRSLAQKQRLSFVTSCADMPKEIVSDRLKVKQIASNLLSNALKYTSEGTVSLTFALHDAKRWVVRVADTGPGLAPESAERLFGGFPGGGEIVPRRGIGLAITKDLVDLLGGSVQVVTKVGSGTVIEVVLPLDATAV